ncbi:unnamed protein product, partial [Phaedon cochleariae]
MFLNGVWLCLLFSTLNCQFVLENFTPTCLKSGLTFFRKTWDITYGDYKMILNVCDYIPDSACGQHQKVCLTHSQNPLKIHGNEFINGIDEQLILNSRQCNVSIQLSCSDHLIENPQLRKTGKCEFEVSMMTVDCAPKCMINYRGHLMNFRPLKHTYHVHSKSEHFSVALCGSNQDCNQNGVSSCTITNKSAIIPLSSVDNEQLTFRDDENEIKLHGSFKSSSELVVKTPSKEKKTELEVLIKCNWTLSTPHIIYKEPQNQGKRFSFLMEAKEGCVKVPPQCVINDKFYTYNVTNLHKNNGYWIVEDVPGNKMMILNVCGLLKAKFNPEDNNCNKSSSQICEIHNDTYTNRGSFHQDLAINNERLSISLTDGDVCDGDPSKQLRTEINFICSKSEGKPKFIKEEHCVTYLNWKTSSACPNIIEAKCENKHIDTHHSCTLETSGKLYNLGGLYKKDGKYTVKDKHDGNLEYLLNVCGSVIDEEAPCMQDAMVALKNSSEANLRHKVMSYGGMRNISENAEGLLVIETYGGGNCGKNGAIIYCRSTVYFKCIGYDEGPMLLSKTDSTLEFLWRTNNSCPEIKDKTRCSFKNPFTGFLVDFTQFKSTQLKIKSLTNSTYFFDFCENDKSKCTELDCKYIALNKTIVEYGNETYLEVNINEHCNSSENQFNKTVFKLTCDAILYNEHFEMKYIKNCILLFELKTHLACLEKEPVIKIDEKLSDNTEYKVQPSYKEHDSNFHEQINENHKVIDVPHHNFLTELNCLVKNPNTGYQFNINSLNLNVTSPKCPEIIFNRTKRYVSLIFETEKTCRQTSVASNKFQSIVILNCPNESNDSPRKTEELLKSSDCLENVILQRMEACKLLEETISQKLGSGSVAGIIIGVIAILSVIGLAVYFYLKWRVPGVRSSYYSMPYNKVCII